MGVLVALGLVEVVLHGCTGATPTPIIVYVTPSPTGSFVGAVSPEPEWSGATLNVSLIYRSLGVVR